MKKQVFTVFVLFAATVAGLSLFSTLYRNLGLVPSMCIIIVFVLLADYVLKRVRFLIMVRKYRNHKEDIWLVSRHPETNQEIVLNSFLDKLITHVDHSELLNTKKDIEECLRLSENQYFNDDDLSDDERLQVFVIPFQDAEAVNEEWGEEYADHIKAEIKARRAARHPLMKKRDEVYYNKFMNGQSGVNWKKQKAE